MSLTLIVAACSSACGGKLLQGKVRVKGWGCRDVRGRADLLHMKAVVDASSKSEEPPHLEYQLLLTSVFLLRGQICSSDQTGADQIPHMCVQLSLLNIHYLWTESKISMALKPVLGPQEESWSH